MPNQIIEITLTVIKGAAAIGIFAALGRLIKKRFAKSKIAKQERIKDSENVKEVLTKVKEFEPKLKEIDQKLHKLTENQRTILNIQQIAYAIFDIHGHCEYASPAFCQLIRHPEVRILESGWLALLVEDDQDRIQKAWKFSVETVSVFDEIFTYRESLQKVHCIAFPKKTEDRKYDGSFAQFKKVD